MIVLDADNGKVVAKPEIGDRVDGVAYDPGLKRIYSSNGDGTMTVVLEQDKNTFSVKENVTTIKGARTITLSLGTHKIFLPVAEVGTTPEATKENPRPRPSIKPNSFMILVVEPL